MLLRRIAMFEAVKMLGDGIPADAVLGESGGKLPPFYSAAKTAVEKARGAAKPAAQEEVSEQFA